MKYFVYTIIGIVAVAVIAGFFIVGSPKEERLRRFDERRVQDLQFIQGEIVYHWQNKTKLPENLAALRDDIRGVVAPKDPETGADYVYEIKGPESFSLCANFNRPSLSESDAGLRPAVPYPAEPYYVQQNWEHKDGFVCFDRKIDRDLYPPTKPR